MTETVLGFSYRIAPQWLWQVYAIENLNFITGSAADFTLFDRGHVSIRVKLPSSMNMTIQANRLTEREFYVKLGMLAHKPSCCFA